MRTKKATINIITGLISLIIGTVIGFISSGQFARHLGVEISGLNNVLINLVSILSVTELGIAGAINYNLYKPVLENDYLAISQIMTFYKKCYFIIGITILSISLAISGFVHHLIANTSLSPQYIQVSFLICAAATIISYFLGYYRNLLYAFQETYICSIVDMVLRIVSASAQILTLILFQDYLLFLIITLLGNLLSNVIITLISKKKHPEIRTNIKEKNKETHRKIFNDVKSLAAIQIGSVLINFTDSLIISKGIGVIVAGMYAYYATLITMLTNIINVIFSNLGASLGNLLAEDNRDSIKKVFHVLITSSFLLGLLIASGLGNAIEPFICLWVGSEYVLDYSIVFVLAVNFYIMVQRQPITYFLRTGGHHKRMILPLAIEAFINLVVSIVLVNQIGLVGVFIGTMVSAIFGWIWNAFTLCKTYGVHFGRYLGKQGLFLLAFLGQFLVSQYVIRHLSIQATPFLQFIYSGLLAVAIPLIICILFLIFSQDMQIFRGVIHKFKQKFAH